MREGRIEVRVKEVKENKVIVDRKKRFNRKLDTRKPEI